MARITPLDLFSHPLYHPASRPFHLDGASYFRGFCAGIDATLATCLIDLLECKFGLSLPADLAESITTKRDSDVLSRWFWAAIKAPSLDAWQTKVGLLKW